MTKHYVLFSLILLIFGSSCTAYLPQTADIPLIEKKNDLRVDAGVSTTENFEGTASLSYGMTKNIAVQVYGTTDFLDRYFFHGAIGYYKKFTNSYVLEIYGGIGNGKGESSNHEKNKFSYANFMQYFAQVNYGKSGGKNGHWDYGFGVKTGFLHSTIDVEYDEVNWFVDDEPPINYSYRTDDFLLEPAIFTRVGGEMLKFGIKVTGLITPFGSTGTYYPPITMSLTLNLRLGKKH